MDTTTSTTTNLDTLREAHRAVAATQTTLDAAYHAAERDAHAAQSYALSMADAAHAAQDAIVERRADLSAAERVARIADSTATSAWQEAHAAQEAESAASAARDTNWQAVVAARDAMLTAAKTATTPAPTPPQADEPIEEVTECSGAGEGEWACYCNTAGNTAGPGSRAVSRHETEAEAARAVEAHRQWIVAGGHPHTLYRYEVRQWDGERWSVPC